MESPSIQKPVSAAISKIDSAWKEMERGATAQSVLNVLDPILEARLGFLLDSLRTCKADLGELLDHRAKICEVWRMRKELQDAGKIGKSAAATLEALVARNNNS